MNDEGFIDHQRLKPEKKALVTFANKAASAPRKPAMTPSRFIGCGMVIGAPSAHGESRRSRASSAPLPSTMRPLMLRSAM